ncbi:MAG: ATP-binding protein [Coriobacteriia bacterium]|nr:ATP-binding protein [Coriobacteriia bacterium]
MTADTVTLTVPSRGEFAKTVRMTASALVSRMGMTFDEVDDVRIAAEEAFVYACDHAPESGEVRLDFAVGDGELEIRVRLSAGSRITDEDAERRAAYATFLLQSVCDTFEMSSDETGPYLRVVKRAVLESEDAEV